ncbi:alpha/beta fold hydrolase [Aquincola sp. S2]|uniref:Alpha/beta fold hydrolase n=1 Tax=Pseudaquabacterium terrae TaxID=2732868 RepID=A0ABX2EA84_9BURK|nr:alpha/beta fold hydrolase [Aquabacterium terrae]NRF65745.1 alpha/beta fold hydrolase [Aquabacterium terrae]
MDNSADRPTLVFLCAHLADERLFAAQTAALNHTHGCRVIVPRDQDSMAAMAEHVLAAAPPRFTLIGLSLGGYVAFEVIRRALPRIERLVLMDTTAAADTPAKRDGRLADIELVRQRGLDTLIPELPKRWLLPAHQQDPALVALLGDMARSVGALGQRNQQTAMLGRPDSLADLERVNVPTLVLCGRQDAVTPLADHQAMAERVPDAQLAVIEDCGHLSAIEQPAAVTEVLRDWLQATAPSGR